MRINLFYLSHNPYGGWASYTAHLCHALASVDCEFSLFKITNKTEKTQRNFGYGIKYRNLSLSDALHEEGHNLICALGTRYKEAGNALLDGGSHIVKHDPGEAKFFTTPKGRTIVIRKTNLSTGATFIPHPYYPKHDDRDVITKTTTAGTVARIDSDKKTEIILLANRLLPAEKQIQIRGYAHTTYARFRLNKKCPEWKDAMKNEAQIGFPKDALHNGVKILEPAKFAVDLSVIKNDGGGTQYTFLEAMDAKCVNVLYRDWILRDDEMIPYPLVGFNCFAIQDAEELARLLDSHCPNNFLCNLAISNGLDTMRRHNVKDIGNKFLEYFTAHAK